MPRRASTTPSEVAPKLIDCVSTQGPQLSASLERWVADYSRDAPAAIAELLSFLVQASGLPGAKLDLDSVHGEAEDGLTDLLTDQTCAELVENAKQLARRAATADSTSPSPPHAFLLPPSHHTLPSTPLHHPPRRLPAPLPRTTAVRPPRDRRPLSSRHARPLPQDAFIEPYPIADKKTGKKYRKDLLNVVRTLVEKLKHEVDAPPNPPPSPLPPRHRSRPAFAGPPTTPTPARPTPNRLSSIE